MAIRCIPVIGWLFVVAIASGGSMLNAQSAATNPTATQQPGSVDGRATNALTGDLVPGATIRLRTLRYAGQRTADPQTRSQADGNFRFDAVAPGNYVLTAEAEGFVTNSAGVRSSFVTIQPGQAVTGVSVQLTPAGSISGKVEDEDGQPVPGVLVIALKPVTTNGRTALSQASNTDTDASGNFVLSKLGPGNYYLVAQPYRDKKAPQQTEEKGGELVRTIYPRGLTFEEASTIQLAAGQSMSDVTVRLRRVSTHHIRGKISEAANGAKAQRARITITGQGTFDSPGLAGLSRTAPVAADGTFDIGGVVPGVYSLRLTGEVSPSPGGRAGRRQMLLGRQDVQVGASDVEGTVVAIVPPVTISGHVRVEPSGVTAIANFSGIRIMARPLEDVSHATQSFANVAADGSFTLNDLDPGLYVINVLAGAARGAYVKSVSLNQQDIMNKEVDLSQGGTEELDVLLRSGAGEVDGTTQSADGPGLATIILVPEHVGPFGAGVLFNYSRQDGTFAVPNVPPGKYLAYAANQADPNLWQNPDFLHLLENSGASVSVDENGHTQVQLQKLPYDQLAEAAGRLGLTLP